MKNNLKEIRLKDYYAFYRGMGVKPSEAKKMAERLIIKEDLIWYNFIAGGVITFLFICYLVLNKGL